MDKIILPLAALAALTIALIFGGLDVATYVALVTGVLGLAAIPKPFGRG